MRSILCAACSVFLLLVAGCRSRYVQTTLTNRTAEPLTVVQVEYPSASFGVQTLAPGQSFPYRFKVYGSGPIKLSYFDTHAVEHHQTGPVLHEGEEGTLDVSFIATDRANFTVNLQNR